MTNNNPISLNGSPFERNVRVIYSYSKQQHYLDAGYTEIIKQAQDITSGFLQELYNDATMTSYKFLRGIERKNQYFRRTDILYFYSLNK